MAPVDPLEQVAELSRRDRHGTLSRRGPDEAAPLQSLHEQAHALGVVPQGFDQITSPATKDKEMPAVRIALEYLLDLERQPVHAFAHVGAAGGEPDPCPARKRDHCPTSTRSTVAIVVGSTMPEIRIRSPPGSSISIDPKDVKAAGAIVTAAKPGTA